MEAKKTALAAIVGPGNVFDEPEILSEYSKDSSFAKPMMPILVVKVQNVQEVQQVIKWAIETGTPLIPVSSGGPRHRGDTVPNVPGAVIVDLSGMKKILAIDRQQRICHIEPGVTYGELLEALKKEGLTIPCSLAPKANKSVIASCLDVEPRTNPRYQWLYFEPLRGMEVVWGDGVRLWTGSGGNGPMNLAAQWNAGNRQSGATGPQNVDFVRVLTQSQGSMGIVTWAALRCHILPKIHKLYFAAAKKSEDLEAFVYKILHQRFGDELMIMNSAYLASLLGADAAEIKALKGEMPPWVALVGITGRAILPEMKVETQELDIADIAKDCGLKLVPAVPGAKGPQVLDKILNPCGEKYWKETYKGAYQDIFFVTTLDLTPKFIDAMQSVAEAYGYPVSDMGIYIQPQHQGTSVSIEFNLPYDASDSKETAKMKEFFTKASEEMSKLGAFYSRPHGPWSRLQLNKDARNYEVLKKTKSIFDPNGIMNPGKLSI